MTLPSLARRMLGYPCESARIWRVTKTVAGLWAKKAEEFYPNPLLSLQSKQK